LQEGCLAFADALTDNGIIDVAGHEQHFYTGNKHGNSGNATDRARLGLRRGGGAVVPCDDGRDGRERTAHRNTRSDMGFETARSEATNL
jgi:hypothetical protein